MLLEESKRNLVDKELENVKLRRLLGMGFSLTQVSEEQLVNYFNKFGSCVELEIIQEYDSKEDADKDVNAFLYCIATMGKFSEAVEALTNYDKVYTGPGFENMTVSRYRDTDMRRLQIEDKDYVPNGVEIRGLPDNPEAHTNLQPFLQTIPGVRCTSILLLRPNRSADKDYRVIAYLETVEMADILLILKTARYLTGKLEFQPLPVTQETIQHKHSMKGPRPALKPIDPKVHQQRKCQHDLEEGFKEGYKKTMKDIQAVMQEYLSSSKGSPAVDSKKLALNINKLAEKSTPALPTSLKCKSQSCPGAALSSPIH